MVKKVRKKRVLIRALIIQDWTCDAIDQMNSG